MPSRADGPPGPPDFVGVGVAGPGTAWWRGLLFAHPQIRPPRSRPPALDFFDDFCHAEMTGADVASYHALFPRAPGTICGEWSGRYMLDAWAPPLIARAAPAARLLVMLADPVERYRSVFAQRRRDFDASQKYRMTDIAERLCHASQLARLQRFFEPEQILVLQYERCLRDRAGQYRRTLEFLGVPDRLPAGPRRPPQPGGGSRQLARAARRAAERVARRPLGRDEPTLWPDLDAALHTSLDPEVERLTQLVPDLDLSLWPSFAHLGGQRSSTAA